MKMNECLSRRFDFRFVTVTNQDSKNSRVTPLPPKTGRTAPDRTAHPDERPPTRPREAREWKE